MKRRVSASPSTDAARLDVRDGRRERRRFTSHGGPSSSARGEVTTGAVPSEPSLASAFIVPGRARRRVARERGHERSAVGRELASHSWARGRWRRPGPGNGCLESLAGRSPVRTSSPELERIAAFCGAATRNAGAAREHASTRAREHASTRPAGWVIVVRTSPQGEVDFPPRNARVHLHHAGCDESPPPRQAGPREHPPRVLSGREDRGHRRQRIGQELAPPHHGRRRQAVRRGGEAASRHAHRLFPRRSRTSATRRRSGMP